MQFPEQLSRLSSASRFFSRYKVLAGKSIGYLYGKLLLKSGRKKAGGALCEAMAQIAYALFPTLRYSLGAITSIRK